MALCILHGWLLEGSGSNLWTRSVITALARAGETVHLVCQENHPELYDAISEAHRHRISGAVEQRFVRDVPYAGKCILHQPEIGETLPVFVWDKYEEFDRVVPMIDLSDEELQTYVERNVAVVRKIVIEHGITAIHANHAVMMPVVAQRVCRELGIPFAVMPHGSGIEYAVKKDARFLRYAESAFDDASTVFVIGGEMRERVHDVLGAVPKIDRKCVELHLGVDTSQFEPVSKSRRQEKIGSLYTALKGSSRGKTPEQTASMLARLSGNLSREELHGLFLETGQYDIKSPDADIEEKLLQVDWERDSTVLFTGRLISSKGPQAILAALPAIFEQVPETRVIVVGHGPLREPMEALLWGLEHGERNLVENIVAWGRALEGDPTGDQGAEDLGNVSYYFEALEAKGELDAYFELARKHVRSGKVIFTGYLAHTELRYLFPCCDLGIFPSVVREAGPLVFLEALASGCFPLGTYFGGMAASIDALSEVLSTDVAAIMKIDPDDTVNDIVTHVPRALIAGAAHKETLAKVARDRYDWMSVAQTLSAELGAMRTAGATDRR